MSNHRTLLQDMKRGINCRLEAIAAIESLEAEAEEQARLLGASGSREAELLARIEALEKKEAVLYSGYDVLIEVRKEQPNFEITHVSDVLDAVVRLQKAALQEGE